MSITTKIARSLHKRKNLRYAYKNINFVSYPLSFYTELLRTGNPFSFVRYGDGEWSAILGRPGANCDGHEYYPELGKRLAAALADQFPYFYAFQIYNLKLDGPVIANYLRERRLTSTFHNADVFAFANVLGRLNPFIEELRRRKVVLIGPAHLRQLSTILPIEHFFEVPPKNCFLAADGITQSIREWGADKPGPVYLFSASMAANVMIHDLYPSLGKQNWLLDLGSLWDIYASVKSRGWFKNLNLQPALDRNLGRKNNRFFQGFVYDNLVLFLNKFHVKT